MRGTSVEPSCLGQQWVFTHPPDGLGSTHLLLGLVVAVGLARLLPSDEQQRAFEATSEP